MRRQVTLQGGFPFSPQPSYNQSNNGDTRNPSVPTTCFFVFNVVFLLRGERVGIFHRKSGLADLRGIRRSDTGELRSDVVDDVEVAVRAIVVP